MIKSKGSVCFGHLAVQCTRFQKNTRWILKLLLIPLEWLNDEGEYSQNYLKYVVLTKVLKSKILNIVKKIIFSR
jgi:hypothetical protein